jgi:hypothetical protein
MIIGANVSAIHAAQNKLSRRLESRSSRTRKTATTNAIAASGTQNSADDGLETGRK